MDSTISTRAITNQSYGLYGSLSAKHIKKKRPLTQTSKRPNTKNIAIIRSL